MGARKQSAAEVLARVERLERENRALRQKVRSRDDLQDVASENEALREQVALLEYDEQRDKMLAAKQKAKVRAAKRTARKLREDNRSLAKMLGEDDDDNDLEDGIWAKVAVGVIMLIMTVLMFWGECSGRGTGI